MRRSKQPHTTPDEPRELRIVFKPSKVSLLKLISRCLKVQIITSRKAGQHVLFLQVMTLCYLVGRGHLAFWETFGILKTSYLVDLDN